MINKLYDVIVKVFEKTNQKFPFKAEEISEKDELTKFGIESLYFVMIMLEIESTFNVSLNVEGFTSCKTVGDIISIIENSK